jgi:L,D-transpeptidase YcbB
MLSLYRAMAESVEWDTIAMGGDIKPGASDPRIPAIRERLMLTGDHPGDGSEQGDVYDSSTVLAVRSFQLRNGLEAKGLIGKQTILALNVPPADRARQIMLNMERWRWMPEDLGSLYVLLNIPAFNVHVMSGGKSVYADKIVVGEMKYATPIFTADLQSVVFNPEWTVPPTIVRENLLPHLRGGGGMFGGGTAVLRQHELNVNYNGKRVDPGSINWNTVNMGAISFTQAPGPKNVLGKVKFIYPNPYSVYMHDTIKKGLFDKEMRAEGHNCPRVGNPGKIAAVILAEDQNMPQAEVDKLLASGYNSGVKVRHRVRVLTAYFTAVADAEGKVATYADLYKIDPPVAAALLGGQARPEAVADNAAPGAEPKPKPQPKPSTVGSAPPAHAAGFAAARP